MVIFVESALKAIKFSALDYLLKPVDIDELKKAIEKQRKRILIMLLKAITTLLKMSN